MGHVTTLNLTRTAAAELLDEAVAVGIINFLALQGDQCGRRVRSVQDGFPHAIHLVRFMRERYGDQICIGVAGDPACRNVRNPLQSVPEAEEDGMLSETLLCHTMVDPEGSSEFSMSEIESEPERSEGPSSEKGSSDKGNRYFRHLADKVAAGADFIVTQCVNDAQDYGSFVEACREEGIRVPVIPGVLPVANYKLFETVMTISYRSARSHVGGITAHQG